MTTLNQPIKIPKHVAIIMDGNGRWAENRGKNRVFGHRNGAKSLRKSIEFAAKEKIQALTVFAFSSENWQRPEQEVNMLMELFFTMLNSGIKKLHRHNIRLKIIGELSGFSQRLQKKIVEVQLLTENNSGLVVNVAANYGGRWDITHAMQKLAKLVSAGELDAADIDEALVSQTLTLHDLPAVDLMIRTGGEQRISNFLLWQLAYAELYFSDVLWPDFDAITFQDALNKFADKERRFGKISAQVNV